MPLVSLATVDYEHEPRSRNCERPTLGEICEHGGRRSTYTCRVRRSRSIASRMSSCDDWSQNGFPTKSIAPLLRARTAIGTFAYAVVSWMVGDLPHFSVRLVSLSK